MNAKLKQFGKGIAYLICAMCMGMGARTVSAGTYTFQKITYSNSDTITPGEWTCRFAKAKTYAQNKNIPLVVVWANPPCSYCKRLESALGGSKDFQTWMKNRGYVMVFALGTSTSSTYGTTGSDVSAAYNYAYTLTTRLDAYPFVAVSWKKNSAGKAVKQNFVGRSARMPVRTGSLEKQFMDSVDSLVGDFASRIQLDVEAEPASGGTVSGGGSFFKGDVATVKAKTGTGSLFAGWYQGSTLLSQSLTYKYAVTGEKDTTLTARFITKEEDLASMQFKMDGAAAVGGTVVQTNVVQCGLEQTWPLEASALTATTISASGLPSGLKLVKDKVSGRYSITGVPKTASKANAKTGLLKPTVAKIKVTTGARNVKTYQYAFIVEPLPSWAVGTFNGGGEEGQVTVTIAANGKVSGKYLSGGKTWTLSAAAYKTFSADEASGSFDLLCKNGRTVSTNSVQVGTLKGDETIGALESEVFTASQNLWKVAPRKDLAKVIAKSPVLSFETMDEEGRKGLVTVTFGTAGTVRVKGQFVYGVSSRGVPQKYTATGSAVLGAQGGDDYVIYLYLPPKKGKLSGIMTALPVSWVEGAMRIL